MASGTYYIPCCGGNCAYGYIVSVTDITFCPNPQYNLYLNNIYIGFHGSCSACGTLRQYCYSETGSCSNIWASCSSCCVVCNVKNGTNPDGSSTYCNQAQTGFTSTRLRSASSITGGSTSKYGSSYNNFNICSQDCGCSTIRASGNNIFSAINVSFNYTGNPTFRTDFMVEKVMIGGSVISSTTGRITFSNGIWSYTGGMANGAMSFSGSSFD